jgi:hypothetical protein
MATKYVFLDTVQRKEFREKWYCVNTAIEKWRANTTPGLRFDPSSAKIFTNKKTLEQEIIDLEDLSLAAYRELKFLRKQLAMK